MRHNINTSRCHFVRMSVVLVKC